MAKHTIKGFITWRDGLHGLLPPEVSFTTFDPRKYEQSTIRPAVVVREHSFEVEVPDDFDSRPAQVAALEKHKQEIRAQFAASVAEIDKRISELQAITYDAPEAA